MSAFLKTGLMAANLIAAATLLGACETLPPLKGKPAVLSNASTQTTAELSEVISNALHGVKVTLAPDALTDSATVIIERPYNEMNGRRMDKPDHFTLSFSHNKCVLTHEETGESYALKHAKCSVIS